MWQSLRTMINYVPFNLLEYICFNDWIDPIVNLSHKYENFSYKDSTPNNYWEGSVPCLAFWIYGRWWDKTFVFPPQQ